MPLNQPSSTITAAFLAGLGVTLLWQLADMLYLKPHGLVIDPALVSTSTTLASGLVGYFKPELVYPQGWKDGAG